MEQDFCTMCGEPIEEGRLRQDQNEEIVCEDCFMEQVSNRFETINIER